MACLSHYGVVLLTKEMGNCMGHLCGLQGPIAAVLCCAVLCVLWCCRSAGVPAAGSGCLLWLHTRQPDRQATGQGQMGLRPQPRGQEGALFALTESGVCKHIL